MTSSASATPITIADTWDDDVVADLATFKYVRAIVFTDGFGNLLARAGRTSVSEEVPARLDITNAALEHAGRALAMGELAIAVTTYSGGTLVSASTARARATVLADAGANLGQLLSYMRRVFPGAHE